MKGYWLRVLGAFALLKAASRIMKDAEDILVATHKLEAVEAKVTVTEVTGNNGSDTATIVEHVEGQVEPVDG